MHADGFKVQFMPRLEGIASLFSRVPTSASVLVHLLAINLFMGCSAFLQGEARHQCIHPPHPVLALVCNDALFFVHQIQHGLLPASPVTMHIGCMI